MNVIIKERLVKFNKECVKMEDERWSEIEERRNERNNGDYYQLTIIIIYKKLLMKTQLFLSTN